MFVLDFLGQWGFRESDFTLDWFSVKFKVFFGEGRDKTGFDVFEVMLTLGRDFFSICMNADDFIK